MYCFALQNKLGWHPSRRRPEKYKGVRVISRVVLTEGTGVDWRENMVSGQFCSVGILAQWAPNYPA